MQSETGTGVQGPYSIPVSDTDRMRLREMADMSRRITERFGADGMNRFLAGGTKEHALAILELIKLMEQEEAIVKEWRPADSKLLRITDEGVRRLGDFRARLSEYMVAQDRYSRRLIPRSFYVLLGLLAGMAILSVIIPLARLSDHSGQEQAVLLTLLTLGLLGLVGFLLFEVRQLRAVLRLQLDDVNGP